MGSAFDTPYGYGGQQGLVIFMDPQKLFSERASQALGFSAKVEAHLLQQNLTS